MKITSVSRGYWEIAMKCNPSMDANTLRNYDMIKMKESGKTIGQIAIKYDLSERQVINICNKYR